MRRTKPRYSLAKKRAEELLEQAGVQEPPVPVEVLARMAGVQIRYEPFNGEMSGLLHRRPHGTALIGVNSMDNETRQRFTIAHELGHFMLHKDELHVDERYPIWFRDDVSTLAIDHAEIEANQFAANLLMPAKFLEKDLRKCGIVDVESADFVGALARRYGVSTQAMMFRIPKFVAYGL